LIHVSEDASKNVNLKILKYRPESTFLLTNGEADESVLGGNTSTATESEDTIIGDSGLSSASSGGTLHHLASKASTESFKSAMSDQVDEFSADDQILLFCSTCTQIARAKEMVHCLAKKVLRQLTPAADWSWEAQEGQQGPKQRFPPDYEQARFNGNNFSRMDSPPDREFESSYPFPFPPFYGASPAPPPPRGPPGSNRSTPAPNEAQGGQQGPERRFPPDYGQARNQFSGFNGNNFSRMNSSPDRESESSYPFPFPPFYGAPPAPPRGPPGANKSTLAPEEKPVDDSKLKIIEQLLLEQRKREQERLVEEARAKAEAKRQAEEDKLEALQKLIMKHNQTQLDRERKLEEMTKKEADDRAAAAKAAADSRKAAEEKERELKEAAAKAAADAKKEAEEMLKPPIKFKDAVGRKFNFPWHLCKTWKVYTFQRYAMLRSGD